MADNSVEKNWQEEQRRRNRQSHSGWLAFDGHRQRVTRHLLQAALGRERPNLTLLGAGNCNDVDLRALLSAYRTVRLVDIDSEALTFGVARQGLGDCPAIVRIGNADLADCGKLPTELFVPAADVAASLCVLSQILEVTVATRGADQSAVLAAVWEARRAHLSLVVSCLRPGGSGLLITDFVSSDTAPQLSTLYESQLPAFAAACIAARNFFTGLNPATILQQIQHDPGLSLLVKDAEVTPPWKWDFGPRAYLVYALQFGRSGKS